MKTWFIYLLTSVVFCAAPRAGASDCTQIFSSKVQPTRAVIIVAHGANLKPSRMDELSKRLQAAGFTVVRPGFTGHCPGDGDLYTKVTGSDWLQDARNFYGISKRLADQRHIPLYLVAYSFSAPIFLTQLGVLPFAKRVLFAPAFATKWWYPPVRFLVWSLPLSFRYKSFNFPDYRANNFAGVASTRALDTVMEIWKSEVAPSLQDAVPTLIFMDPQDELVSYGAIQSFLTQKKWPSWRIENVTNEKSTSNQKFHHLIIDEEALGKEEWNRVVNRTIQFFSGDKN